MANVIRLMDKTALIYSTNQLPAAQAATIPVALNVDVSMYRELTVLLRLHSYVAGLNVKVEAYVFNSARTAEDPGLVFRGGTPIALATGTWSANGTFLYTGTAVSGVGSHIDCVLIVTQPAAAVAISIIASIDLVGKTG